MDRTGDGRRLSDFAPAELEAFEGGLVAVGIDVGAGTLTLSISHNRICGYALLSNVRRTVGEGLRERLDAWREVHVPAGESVIDGLVRVLRPTG